MPFVRSVLAVALLCACTTQPVPQDMDLPAWLRDLISELESQPVANPPLWIARYDYLDQTVYYLPPRCCDVPSVLYDVEGTVLCSPDGGISGGGDGRCPDFFDERENEVIVWRDSRVPSGAAMRLPARGDRA